MSLVAFASWRCNCTMLAETMDGLADRCPTHGDGLLARPSWEANPHTVPLGLEAAYNKEAAESHAQGSLQHGGSCEQVALDCNTDHAEAVTDGG